jgi:endonuclease/exonuclease/phosphatase family metal-dependent hydrolase
MVKVVTINILFGPESWGERRELLVEGLLAEQPDCILAQEVWEDAGNWLADRLSLSHQYWVPYHRPASRPGLQDGIAILSRHPLLRRERLILSEGHGWVAQRAEIAPADRRLVLCNGHYYWHPGPHPERDQEVQRVVNWLGQLPPEMPIVVGGDFNGTPESSAIARMRQHFTSAYAAHNGEEPRFTCPTPLAFDDWQKPWRGTLDYLFVNRYLRVLTRHNPYIYPSDHLGLVGALDVLSAPTLTRGPAR